MIPRPSRATRALSIRSGKQTYVAAASWVTLCCRLLSLLLAYALLVQSVPHVGSGVRANRFQPRLAKRAEKSRREFNWSSVEASAGAWSEAISAMSGGTDISPSTIADAVVSRHKPTLNSGRIEGTLRLLQGESFTINGSTQLTSDLYLPGTPLIQLNKGAQYGGTISEGSAANPANYTVSLTGGVILPGQIHTNVDAVPLPSDFPNSVPAPTGTRTLTIDSQSDVAAIGNWQTVRDLNVTGSHLSLEVPPGNYRTFTVNGNSQLNFTAGIYNFSNTFNLDGSAKLRATGPVTINVAQNLTVNSGALVLGSYTSPGDVRLNVLGSFLNVNGSSQVSGLIRAYNGTVILNGGSQLRGQVIANSLTLNGGKIIGAVWPFQSGNALTVFGPRRFDRTTGPPNQYLEQFALPAGVTSPYTMHIQNGEADGSSRISSATIKLNGVDVLKPTDLNQNIGSLDRTIVLAASNQLEVRLESVPGSYLIINIAGIAPGGDTLAPAISITSPIDHSSTTATHTDVSGTASDIGNGASGMAHVYVNDAEAAYNSSDGTWTISNVTLALGANQLIARAVDQSGNEATASITVTRESPTNLAPTAGAGPDQTIALPQTASLQGAATDDGPPESSSLATTWSKVSGPGAVTFVDNGALNTTASFSSAGTYVLRLTASDGSLSTADDLTITVQPENQPPTVNAGPDQTVGLPHHATLNGSVTDDGLPEAGTLTITWTEVSGPSTVTFADASLAETTASFSLPGTYVLRLTASDTELTSNSDVTITVQPENHAPTVNAGPDQIISLPDTAQLNGAATDDAWPAGISLTTSWNFISGSGPVEFDNPNSPSTIARFASAGNYLLRLTASDGELSSTDDVSITVTPPNQAPSVNAGLDQTIFLPNSAVDLNGTISDDALPLGSSVLTRWSQVSGPGPVVFANPNVTVTSATFSEVGTYVLRLTASDSQLAAVDDITIIVTDPRVPPLASFTVPESIGIAGAFAIAASGAGGSPFPADNLLDDNNTTVWNTPSVTNQFVKFQFYDQQNVFIDRVRLQSNQGTISPTNLKDFEIQISATTADDASFVTVLSATMLNNGQLQEFVLPGGPIRARFLKLLLKNNYGSPSSISPATFNPVAVGSIDSVVSLPGQTNVARLQSPALVINGGAIYSSSYGGGANSADGLLGYGRGGFITSGLTNEFAIIQLGGGKVYNLKGVRLATWFDAGFGNAKPTAVKDFEVWVSATTADQASFTKVFSATAAFVGNVQTFIFPGGPAPARYVKYVPLNNQGGGTVINTAAFDVIVDTGARVISSSGELGSTPSPPEAAFDGDSTTIWNSPASVATNVSIKTALTDDKTQRVYGFRISGVNNVGLRGPKDIEIRVSTTTTDDAAFNTVYTGTLAATVGPQEILLSNTVDAKYVQFFWKNGYSAQIVSVYELEVLAAPDRGSAVVAFSRCRER